jgi:EAL domain-containing protein (putative c-di-GMP-specific phosphodiesterase class I)/GGDEF domain-containing protein
VNAIFAIVAIDRFAALKRTIGYSRAVGLLEGLATDIRAMLPVPSAAWPGRNAVELSFSCETAAKAEDMLMQLAADLAAETTIAGYVFRRTVTIGAIDAGDLPISDELVEMAENALERAREARAPYLLADQEDFRPTLDGLHLMRDLQQAIRDDALTLHYQPKIRSRSGEVASVEALLRWPHPTLGMIPPDQFIPLAEESGNIAALTQWVLDHAIVDQALLARIGIDLAIDINLSGVLVADRQFRDLALARIAAANGKIGFEITETAMMHDPEGALANLEAFAAAGIRLSIDDYGSGFSSLAYLQRLPVQELKIDKIFVSRLASEQRDPLLVRSTIDLAHALEMEVTAEGVETPETLALLQVMGCDLVQGFYLARPLELGALVDFVKRKVRDEGPVIAQALRERLRRRAERGALR